MLRHGRSWLDVEISCLYNKVNYLLSKDMEIESCLCLDLFGLVGVNIFPCLLALGAEKI